MTRRITEMSITKPLYNRIILATMLVFLCNNTAMSIEEYYPEDTRDELVSPDSSVLHLQAPQLAPIQTEGKKNKRTFFSRKKKVKTDIEPLELSVDPIEPQLQETLSIEPENTVQPQEQELKDKPINLGEFTSYRRCTPTKNNIKSRSVEKIQQQVLNDSNSFNEKNSDVFLNIKMQDEQNMAIEYFYDKKDIVEEDGTFKMITMENDRTTDALMDEIINNTKISNAEPVKISLKDCIGLAISRHPDVMAARISTDIYKSRITQAWSAYFPTFSAGVSYDYNYTRYPQYHVSQRSHSTYYPNMSAGLLLFDFGKTKTAVDIAVTEYDASRYELQSSINDIIYNVKSAYYNVIFAQHQVDVYKKTIEDFELQLRSAQKFFSIGKKPKIDVAIAEYNAGNAKLNLVKATNTLETAKVELANALGLPKFSNFELTDELPSVKYSAELEELLEHAFSTRPDLLSYEKQVEAYLLSARLAKRQFTPNLTADGVAAYNTNDSVRSSQYSVGVNLSYSGMNLMELKQEYDIAMKSYKKSLADYESLKQQVYMQVKQGIINLDNSVESVKQATMNVSQAQAQHYHATGRYNGGVGDAIEIKDAENTYLNAQLEYYGALLDYNLYVAELERYIGHPLGETGYSISDLSEI